MNLYYREQTQARKALDYLIAEDMPTLLEVSALIGYQLLIILTVNAFKLVWAEFCEGKKKKNREDI